MKFAQARTHQFLAFLFVILGSLTTLVAQTNYGSIRGEVTDVQGASIGSAAVTLTSQDTKVAHIGVTNDKGVYQFGGVDPGTYKITISMSGFKTFDSAGNVVSLGSTTTVDAKLMVGAKSEVVEVTADSMTLNTANATAEQVFTAQQIQDLPNLGRDPFMFAQFDANVVTLGDPRYVRAEDSSGISDVSLGRAPGYDTATASLNKNLFTIHERFKLQYRIEALNLYNTPQFATPGTTLNIGSYGATPTTGSTYTGTAGTKTYGGLGVLSSQAGFGRIIQMGGRLTF